jgi:uncharacterized membrane protein
MMYWNGHMTAAGWIIAILWTVIIFALIAGAIFWLVSTLSSGTPGSAGTGHEASAREILDRRLAKGELTVDQYDELCDKLDARSAPSSDQRPASPAGAPG